MLDAVSANLLNVRSLPSTSSTVVGQLTRGMVIVTTPVQYNWVQFRFGSTFGFVSGSYLQKVHDLSRLTGSVNTDLLNIRQAPSTSASVLATVALGASIKTLAVAGDWLEIEFNGHQAYTFAKHVDLVYADNGYYANVTAAALNVRSAPNKHASIFGQLAANSLVWVEGKQQNWCQIRFNGNRGYAASAYLQAAPEINETHLLKEQDHQDPRDDSLTHHLAPSSNRLEPSDQLTPDLILTVAGSKEQRAVAATWNRWGGLLTTLCVEKGIDVACAVAVLCVESRGKGFEQNNADRLIIRFENHKFWRYWGKHHPQQYRQHFSYNPKKVWTEHQWRMSPSDPWQSFHGVQAKEWQVFEFARSLDEDAAMLSISMGAPQIMGFHYERIGYQSVVEMFDAFCQGIPAHIHGLFEFFDTNMHQHLRDHSFENFAALYNGSGQKALYGRLIKNHNDAFAKLHPNA
ncbi:N-acetylmuramidase domain-containing protein [Paraglaciecola chathamensis]|uniref:SH3 protein, type 3 n=1 Tax=Paraglaciecola agarilytica NO2 TaxID=1125747 RepID=A0ABQ0I6R1_9ALTE|nr:N-acetylmuramidase domain-containing protein [Paraglaciecola agarilytica]GAC05045.1 SH3 protein, type 3 [Paraglaciecola agarilytica NO2]